MVQIGLSADIKDTSVNQMLDMLGSVFFRLNFTHAEAEQAFMDVAKLALEHYASKTFEHMSAEEKTSFSKVISDQHKTDTEKLNAIWEIAAKESSERAMAFMSGSFREVIRTYLDELQNKIPSVKNIREELDVL